MAEGWSDVDAARVAWRRADAEITRAATVQGELEALAAAAERDSPGEPAAALAALDRFGAGGTTLDGGGTATETTADRRAALAYVTEPAFDGRDAIAAFGGGAAVGPAVDAVVRALRAFVEGGEWPPVRHAVGAAVERPETGWTGEDRTALAHLAALFDRITEAAVRVRDRRVADLTAALRAAYDAPGDPINDLSEQPVALLPVRLETRFVDPADGVGVEAPTLRLRVFPDQIHVDGHEPELTRAEERWAENFWALVWLAAHPEPASVGTDEAADRVRDRLGSERLRELVAEVDLSGFSSDWRARYDELKERAWRQVLDRYGRERGSYVVHAMAPERGVANRLLAGPPRPPEPEGDEDETASDGRDADDADDGGFEFPGKQSRGGEGERSETGDGKSPFDPSGTTFDRDALTKRRREYEKWNARVRSVDAAGNERTPAETDYDRALAVAAADYEEPTLDFPAVPRRSGQWTRAARAALLPDRFVAVLHWTDDEGTERRYVQAGDPVQEPLPVGPSAEPDGDAASPEDAETASAPPGTEWLTDFAEAERVGMALSVPLSALDGLDATGRGIDRVVVLGVKASLSARDTPGALRDLLDAHHYTDGLSFVAQGTPTNAGREADAAAEDEALASLPVELDSPLVATGDRSDGDLLARALAVDDPDQRGDDAGTPDHAHVFAHVAGADATDQRDARHVNTVLWPATMGYTLSHLLVSNAYTENPSIWGEDGDPRVSKSRWYGGLDEPLAWLDTYRRHFVRYVRGEGPLPTMRVGRQPYGVLPATAIEPEPVAAFVPPGIVDRLADRELTLGDAVVETGIPLEQFVEAVESDILLGAGGDPGDLYRAGLDAGTLAESVEIGTLRSAGVAGRDLVAAGVEGDALRAAGYDARTVDAAETAASAGDASGQKRATSARRYAVDVTEPADRAEREQYAFPFDPALPLGNRRRSPVRFGNDDGDATPDGDTASVRRARSTGRDDELPAHLASYVRRFRSVWDEAADTLPEELDEETLIETLKREAVSSVVRRQHEYFPAETGGDDPAPLSSLVSGLIDDRKAELREDLRWADLDDLDPRLTYLAQLDLTDPDLITPVDVVDGQVERFVEVLLDLPVADLAQLSWDMDPEVLPVDPAALDLTRDEWDARDEDGKRRAIVRAIERSEDPYGLYNRLLSLDAKAEESDRGEASRARLLQMVRLQDTYGEPGLLSTLVRLLVHYGHMHAYLNARVRLGTAYGDPPAVGPDPGSYRPWDRTVFDELYDDAPQSLMAHPDLDGDESYAEALRLAAADYETTTSIDPQLSEYTDSLAYLGSMEPTDLADQLFSTLDLSNHRLDAWWTSLATKRLFELRTAQGQFGGDDARRNWVTGEPWADGGEREDGGEEAPADFDTDGDATAETLRATTEPGLLWTIARAVTGGKPETVTKGVDGATVDDTTRTAAGNAVSVDAAGRSWAGVSVGDVVGDDDGLAVDPSTLEGLAVVPPPGLYVGAYGYVENLRKDTAGAAATPEYVHAPSEQQATTAALLRSGYRAFADGDALAVDLSAERVRDGQRLLRGVRRGQPLGELLGYRLERRLRERTLETWDDPPLGTGASDDAGDGNLMKYLPALRTLFPADPGRPGTGDTPRDAAEAALARSEVTDGYRLVRGWDDYHGGSPERSSPTLGDDVRDLPGPSTPNGRALVGVVDELRDAVDAVGDLLTAEAVHQLGQGNVSAAAGSIDALARGEPLPNPTVVDVPRTETGIGHRQFLALDPQEDASAAPADRPPHHVRARAEPALEAWVDDLLVPPSSVGCTGEFTWTETSTDGITGAETEAVRTESVATTLDALDLSALDVLAVAVDGDSGDRTELDERIGYHLRRTRPARVPADADLGIDPTDPGSAPLAVVDLLELAGSLRDVVGEARPLESRDLLHPDDESGVDAADLRRTADTLAGRADAVSSRLTAVRTALDERLGVLVPDSDERAALFAAAERGTTAVPDGRSGSAAGEDSATAPGTEPPVTARVADLTDALAAFADRVDLDGIASVAGSLDGGAVRSELAGLLADVPAGPTDAEAIPETVRVGAAPDQVLAGSILDPGDTAIAAGGTAGDSTAGSTQPLSPEVVALDDLGASAGPNSPSGPDLSTSPDLGLDPGIDPATIGQSTVDVEVWGTDGVDWVERSASVTADASGRFAATFDFSGVAPGTPITVAASVNGETAYAARGRVVPDGDPTAVDDEGDPLPSPGGPDPTGALAAAPTLLGLLWLSRRREVLDADAGTAGALETALTAVDWAAVDRERSGMDTAGALTADDLAAVDALRALAAVSMADLDDALAAALDAVEGLGLLSAFDLDPSTGSPAGGDLWFAATTDAHRVRAALAHATTNPAATVSGVDPALRAFAPGVALALDATSDPPGAAAAIDALLSLPGWAVTGLGDAVAAPAALVRDLTAWCYHPAEFDAGHGSLSSRLSTLAGALPDYLDDLLADLPRAAGQTPRDALAASLSDVASVVGAGPHGAPTAAATTAAFDQGQNTRVGSLATGTDDAANRFGAALDGVAFDEAFRNAVLEPLRGALVEASAFGVYASTPVSADGGTPDDEAALLGQALAVRAAAERRLATEVAILGAGSGTGSGTDPEAGVPGATAVPPAQAVEDGVDRLHALLGESFTVLPPFTPPNAAELAATYTDGGLLPEGAALAPETWLQRVAQVRDRPAALRDAYGYAEALAGDLKRTLAVGQLPHRPGDVWAGVEPPHRGDAEFTPGTLSLVAGLGPGVAPADLGGRIAGLFVDEWVDSIPAEAETTGVAIEYDDPGARAPQSILLAVPPDDGRWSLRDLTRTVVETMEYARLRTVDLGDTDRLDAILPGLFVANSRAAKPRTPSVDFDMLDRYDHELVAMLVQQTFVAVPYQPTESGGDEA